MLEALRSRGLRPFGCIDQHPPADLDGPSMDLQAYLAQRVEGDLIAITSSAALEIASGLLESGVEDFEDWRIVYEHRGMAGLPLRLFRDRCEALAIQAWVNRIAAATETPVQERMLERCPLHLQRAVRIEVESQRLMPGEGRPIDPALLYACEADLRTPVLLRVIHRLLSERGDAWQALPLARLAATGLPATPQSCTPSLSACSSAASGLPT